MSVSGGNVAAFRVGKVENGRDFFAASGGQTNELLQLKAGLIYMPMSLNCSFSIRSCVPLPHAKLSGTTLRIDTRHHVNFLAKGLP